MEHLQNIGVYLPNVFAIHNLAAMMGGIVIGLVIGAIPGLNPPMAIALLLPVSFYLPTETALIMLVSLYAAAIYGGSFSAILLGAPGTAASAATCLDGFEMTKQGRHAEAIRISMGASVVGGILSGLVLLFLSPILAEVALVFQPLEIFLVAVFGLLTVGSVAVRSPVKGLISGFLGVMLSCVGLDVYFGHARYTFGIDVLQGGFLNIPVVIGLFAFAQALRLAWGRGETITTRKPKMTWKLFPTWGDFVRYKVVLVRSWLIGFVIGAIPGTGASVAQWIAYGETVRRAKPGERFGYGEPKGVAAAEAANNSTTGTTLIPTFVLGIPGGVSAAVILAALMIHGLQPGFALFSRCPDVIYPVMLAFILANALMGLVAVGIGRGLSEVIRMPRALLVPMVIVFCIAGTYGAHQQLEQVWIMCSFGVMGYFMLQHGFSPPAMLIGIILGPICEVGFRFWLLLGDPSPIAYLIGRPLSIMLSGLVIFTLGWLIVRELRSRKGVSNGTK